MGSERLWPRSSSLKTTVSYQGKIDGAVHELPYHRQEGVISRLGSRAKEATKVLMTGTSEEKSAQGLVWHIPTLPGEHTRDSFISICQDLIRQMAENPQKGWKPEGFGLSDNTKRRGSYDLLTTIESRCDSSRLSSMPALQPLRARWRAPSIRIQNSMDRLFSDEIVTSSCSSIDESVNDSSSPISFSIECKSMKLIDLSDHSSALGETLPTETTKLNADIAQFLRECDPVSSKYSTYIAYRANDSHRSQQAAHVKRVAEHGSQMPPATSARDMRRQFHGGTDLHFPSPVPKPLPSPLCISNAKKNIKLHATSHSEQPANGNLVKVQSESHHAEHPLKLAQKANMSERTGLLANRSEDCSQSIRHAKPVQIKKPKTGEFSLSPTKNTIPRLLLQDDSSSFTTSVVSTKSQLTKNEQLGDSNPRKSKSPWKDITSRAQAIERNVQERRLDQPIARQSTRLRRKAGSVALRIGTFEQLGGKVVDVKPASSHRTSLLRPIQTTESTPSAQTELSSLWNESRHMPTAPLPSTHNLVTAESNSEFTARCKEVTAPLSPKQRLVDNFSKPKRFEIHRFADPDWEDPAVDYSRWQRSERRKLKGRGIFVGGRIEEIENRVQADGDKPRQ